MQFFQLDTLGDLNDLELCQPNGPPEGMELRSYCLSRGKRAARFYPKEAKIFLEERYPGIKLTSLLRNTDSFLIVHSTMKDVIASYCQGVEVEYLPFDLYDHRKRLYTRDYLFINPIGTLDCLDPVASRVKYGPEGSVIHVGRFVLDPKKLVNAPNLFRPQEQPSEYIVSEELAQALRDKGFTNVILEPLAFSTAA